MTCDDLAPLMLAFLDGRLDARQRAEVEAHMAACDACRKAAAIQNQVASVLASRPDAPVSRSFLERVQESIDRDPGWFAIADWRRLTLRLAPVAALLLVAGGFSVERTTRQTPPVSLADVVETWATGDSEEPPAPTVLWQAGISDDSVMMTVLAASPDDTIGRPVQ